MTTLPTVHDCGDCGVCCLHMGYPPYLQDDRGGQPEQAWIQMPAALKSDLLDFMAGHSTPAGELDGPCVWYDVDQKRCRHHRWRPRVCRDFRVGSRGCLEWRKVYRIGMEPGSVGD